MNLRAALVLCAICSATDAVAAPPPPTGPHPRMLLDAQLRSAWQAQAAAGKGPVVAAIDLCDDAGRSNRHDRGVYQSQEWSKVEQACLVAWAATGKADHAKTVIRFFNVLLDDLDDAGDGKGGDAAATRDSGYAIRNMGLPTALAYDWLYDQLSPQQREHARARWAAWLAAYAAKGYRAHAASSNYHAGYAMASTAIAIAEAGEAGAEGNAQWTRVVDELWGKEMAAALAPHGALSGGDDYEGWQYAPLAMAQYALAARLMKQAGVAVPGVDAWLHAILQRHVYALSPAEQVFAGGDTETEAPNVPVYVLTLDAVALGDASAEDRRYARGELARLQLADQEHLLFDALATVGDKPVYVPREKWPTWYVADNTQTLYARTRWDGQAVWFVASCSPEFDMDHRHSDAGNFVLSRGKDDAVVDPTPYGSFSSLTGNAPTIRSPQLPKDIQPSQGPYGGGRWRYAAQTASGVVAARCDYTDRFKYHETPSDIPEALRDFVLLPSKDGTAATVVVVDRATTGGADREMYLRFRSPGKLALDGGPDRATATVGATRLSIASFARSSGTPKLGGATGKNCDNVPRGSCEAARFDITDYRVDLAGGSAHAATALSVTDASAGGGAVTTTALTGDGWAGIRVAGTRDAVVIWPTTPGGASLTYTVPHAPAMTHVVIDAPQIDDRATVTAKPSGDGCAVTITGDNAATALPARPLVVTVDGSCAVAVDRAAAITPSAAHTKAPHAAARSPRAGCCDAGGSTPVSAGLAIGLVALARRRRRARVPS